MTSKKLLTVLATAIFTMSFAGPALSTETGKMVNGYVTKIEGSKLTVVDSMGNEKTIEAKDKEALKEIKVGDQVSMKNDLLTKERAESQAPSQKF